jgi:nicotinamidase-related amidase
MVDKYKPVLSERDDSILVVIDVQTKLTSAMPVKVLARLQRYTGLLIKSANLLQIPVIITEQYPNGLGHIEPELNKLLSNDTRRFEKTTFSCVKSEGFIQELNSSKKKQIILTGMEAHVCVLQTAMDLINEDYSVIVVADAICSRSRENYENALERMQQAGASITNAESVIFEWVKDAKHPQFKKIQSLIR